MNALTVQAQIDADGHLRVDIPIDLPPGPVELVLLIRREGAEQKHDIRDLRGLGRDIWSKTEAQDYVRALREEWRS